MNTKLWRPSNWGEIVTDNYTKNYDEAGRLCFEAGAEAMLEVLQVQPAVRLRNDLETIDQYVIKVKDLPDGTWRVLVVPEEDK